MLNLVKYIGEVDSEYNLYEAASEELLAEYFRRQRAQSLPDLLRSIAPEERRFFDLFLLEDPFPILTDPSTGILPNHLYRAGLSLQDKELLDLREGKGYVRTFTLPEDVCRLVPELLGGSLLRTEVQLDLNKVAAPDSSGGGA